MRHGRSTLALLVMVVLAVGSVDTGPSNPAALPASNTSLEYKLAVIDGHVDPSDETLRSYGRVLDLLQRVFPNRQKISDVAVRSQQVLREENIDESLLGILVNVRASIPADATSGEVGDCAEFFTVYVALRIGNEREIKQSEEQSPEEQPPAEPQAEAFHSGPEDPAPKARTDEEMAAVALKLAKLLFKNAKTYRAEIRVKTRLTAIINDYPDTKAADEARRLLVKINEKLRG